MDISGLIVAKYLDYQGVLIFQVNLYGKALFDSITIICVHLHLVIATSQTFCSDKHVQITPLIENVQYQLHIICHYKQYAP